MQQLAKDYEAEDLKDLPLGSPGLADERAAAVVSDVVSGTVSPSGRRPLCSYRQGFVAQTRPANTQPATTQALPDEGLPEGWQAPIHPIQSAPSARFALMARAACDAARSLGLNPPGFMSPPRHKTADRTIRRASPSSDTGKNIGNSSGESCLVAVRIKGRPLGAIQADIVEGVIIANNLTATQAAAVRTELWRCLTTLASDE